MAKKTTEEKSIIIQQLEIKAATRNNLDIKAWRDAIKSAENVTRPNRKKLYDLYTDILLDGKLKSSINKRKNNIANIPIVFKRGEEIDEKITNLCKTKAFRTLIKNALDSIFWGHSLQEVIFTEDSFKTFLIPRKHVLPGAGIVIKTESDTTGINYREGQFLNYLIECGEPDDLGLLCSAAQYVIYKRNDMGDWAQHAEIFGMPMRIGTYDSHDPEARRQLNECLEASGSATYMVKPRGTDIEIVQTGSGASSNIIYKDLKSVCDEEILILILGQTMTTQDGSSRSQSEVHENTEDQIHITDKQFTLDFLNNDYKRLLEVNGYNPGDGEFDFKKMDSIGLETRIDIDTKLNQMRRIKTEYLSKTYNVPLEDTQDALIVEPTKKQQPPKPPQDANVNEIKYRIEKAFNTFKNAIAGFFQ